MDTIRQLCGFAAGLERLLVAKSAAELEATWDQQNLGQLGWEALSLARRANTETLEPALAVVDRCLLAALEWCRAFLDPHIVTFRVPELERWQHAAAAALVGPRGAAALRGAARCGSHRRRGRPLRGHARARRRPEAHGARGRQQ